MDACAGRPANRRSRDTMSGTDAARERPPCGAARTSVPTWPSPSQRPASARRLRSTPRSAPLASHRTRRGASRPGVRWLRRKPPALNYNDVIRAASRRAVDRTLEGCQRVGGLVTRSRRATVRLSSWRQTPGGRKATKPCSTRSTSLLPDHEREVARFPGVSRGDIRRLDP